MLLPLQILNLLTSSGDHTLNADDVESASEVSSPTVGQEHALTSVDIESASEVGSPSVGQEHALTSADIESASEVSAPTLTASSAHPLLADDVESASETSAPTIGQVHALTPASIQSLTETSTVNIDGKGPVVRKSGRSGKRKRYVVEVEGEYFEVPSVQAAQEVLQQVRDLAEESAKSDVTTDAIPKPPRVSIKTASGKATTSKPLAKAVRQTQKTINRAYVQAAKSKQRDAEIAALLLRKTKQEAQDEEEALIALLL